ncbi:Integral membrane protein YggT, involved in response to extracytoplasmic stress (osmotic shock) [Legionella beliardensis]|uniref:Integral membrane protein YggT, involved in response to extracytoplasmic stress (Osmotic shock) n=1 Tax=Legionella beliardensis TaxID=91822 RepID=A0A378I3B8_9GAMM|nr:YggT family protein [Legionella beliardensis]STX29658.1 Integral membrane protein YggT, involved in response to extracytoplasmic stress (osmotic shock) [Legionella beliardensis]
MAGLIAVSYFLITIFFNLIIFVLWLRIIMRYYRVSPLHPMGQAIYRLTDRIVLPIEAMVYSNKRRPHRFDYISFSYIIIVEIIKFILLGLIAYRVVLPLIYLLLFVIGDLVIQLGDLLFYALLIRIILSWANPQWQAHPAAMIINLITDPLIRIGHRIVPNISGFDFAPFIVMIILKVITLFISASLPLHL